MSGSTENEVSKPTQQIGDMGALQSKAEETIRRMQEMFPDCEYTVTVLLWDDATSSIECRYGIDEPDGSLTIYTWTYYDGKYKYDIRNNVTPWGSTDKYGQTIDMVSEKLKKALVECFGSIGIGLEWMLMENIVLGDSPPIEFIHDGKEDEVINLLYRIMEGKTA